MASVSRARRFALVALLLACGVLFALGVETWSSVSSDVYTREFVTSPCPRFADSAVLRGGGCPGAYERVATRSRPNRAPAIVAFAIGGVMGLLLVVLSRSRQPQQGGVAQPVAS
jgi:hypothetical protein